MKIFKKHIIIVFIALLISALSACGSTGEVDIHGSSDSSPVISDDEAAEGDSTSKQETDASTQAKEADEPETSDSEEAAHLLDVTFFADKDEAESAAGERLLVSYDSDAANSDEYNPMSWCYAMITAIHNDTTVVISRGYEGITRGDEFSGFVPTDMECYEFLDAGDRIVMQVNVEWYPVFSINVFDEDYKTTITLGGDIYNSKDKNGIPAPLEVMGLKIIYPIALYREEHFFRDEGSFANYPYYTYDSSVELLYADDDNPELAERLDEMNAEICSEYEEGLGMLGLEAAEAYAFSSPDGNEHYSKNLRTSLCRADDTVLSFVRYYDTNMNGEYHSSAVGYNLDTAAGRDVGLDEVLTDISALPDTVYERCAQLGYDDAVCEAFMDITEQYVDDGDYTSSSFFSWNIGYEGLWLHFNDSVSDEILSRAFGRNSLFLPFGYYPEMFAGEYTNVPEAYCYDIETNPMLGEYYALELNKDGKYVDFALRDYSEDNRDSGGFTEELSVEIDSKTAVLEDGISCAYYDAFVVHSEADLDYLYIQQYNAEDTDECAVYQLSYTDIGNQELYHARNVAGSVNNLYAYGDPDDHSNGINGRIMTNPGHFLMTRRDNRLGYGIVYAFHELARDGGPMRSDYYWTYAFDGSWKLYPLKNMKVFAVNDDCEVTGETTLFKNTLIRPYRTDSYGWIDVIDQDGNIYRIETEKTVENPEVFRSANGEAAEEIFGGISNG